MRKNKLVRRVIAVCPKYLGKSVAAGAGASLRPGAAGKGSALLLQGPRAGVGRLWCGDGSEAARGGALASLSHSELPV